MRSDRRLSLLSRLVIMTGAFCVPLAFYIGAYEAFNLPKTAVIIVLGLSALCVAAARGVPLESRALFPAAVFFAFGAASMFRTPLLDASLERMAELGALCLLLVAAESPAVPKRRLLAAVIFAHFLVTLYGAFQYLDMDFINWTAFGPKRVYSTMGNPNFLAAQTSLLFPVALCLIFAVRALSTRILLGTSLIFALPSLLYTQTRGAIVAFAVSCVAIAGLAWAMSGRRRLWQYGAWGAGGFLLLAALLFMLPTGKLFLERFREFADPVKSPSVQTRLFYGYSGWLMGTDYEPGRAASPLAVVGNGIGAFHLSGARTQGIAMRIWERRWPRASEQTSPHLELYAHNDYIHMFAEIGPLGLGIYLWILICLLAGALQAASRVGPERRYARWLIIGVFGGVSAFCANTAVNFVLKVPQNAHLFISCLIPILLFHSHFRPIRVSLPKGRFFLTGLLLLGLYFSGRPLAKMAGSQYLKLGHTRAQTSANPAAGLRPAGQTALLEQALALYGKARRLRPFHTDAILVRYYSGVAFQRLGRTEEALAAYDDAIEIFRDFPEAHRSRGFLKLSSAVSSEKLDPLERSRTLDAAILDLQRACALNPKDAEALFNLGYAYQTSGDDVRAVAAFSRTNRLTHPGQPESYYFLAVSYLRLNQPEPAREALEILISRFPSHKTVPSARALLRQISGGTIPRI